MVVHATEVLREAEIAKERALTMRRMEGSNKREGKFEVEVEEEA